MIPARDAAATIRRTLAAVAEQGPEIRFEVIVVDDGSGDETVHMAERAGARVLHQPQRGPGQARNLGAAEARGTVLAFTDADCYPAPGWLASGLRAIECADLVQGRVLPDPTAARGPFDHTIWVVEESGLYETANLFVRRERFLELGGFEDWLEVKLGKRLGEDVWFGWKARRAGARTAFARDALVHHAVFPRRWPEYVAERRRLVYFPDLVRKMPELRRHFLQLGLFVTPRSGQFAAAAAGIALAAGTTFAGTRRGALLPAAAAAPYLWSTARRAHQLGRHGARTIAVEAMADAVGFSSLVHGSLRSRTPVL